VNLLGDYLVELLGIGHESKYILDVEKTVIATRVTSIRILSNHPFSFHVVVMTPIRLALFLNLI
jgi:hypothetical protein